MKKSMHLASSGNLMADRRYDYAMSLLEAGDREAAIDLFRQALGLAPHWAAGHFALGEALSAAGLEQEAKAVFITVLDLDPEDRFGASARLARLAGATPSALPQAHVRALFDQYAPRFEESLCRALGYRAPQLLRAALERAFPARDFDEALDLGCGTGLMARALAGLAGAIDGVDLSPDMARLAAASGLYRQVVAEEVTVFLRKSEGALYDLGVAADVLVYMGDLRPLTFTLHQHLKPQGVFAFTVQATEGAPYALGSDYRFAHSAAYLEAVAAEAGFTIILHEEAVARQDRGQDVPGFLCLWQKR